MASVNWLRRVVDRPWPVPDFVWIARKKDRRWRYPLRCIAGCLRVVMFYPSGFAFRMFVWFADVEDVLTNLDDR